MRALYVEAAAVTTVVLACFVLIAAVCSGISVAQEFGENDARGVLSAVLGTLLLVHAGASLLVMAWRARGDGP